MRYAIIADIHGNLDALEAVVKDIEGEGVDETLCLGDLIGYGAEPGGCIKLAKSVSEKIVVGNHDAAVTGGLSLRWFNDFARQALVWASGVLSAAELKFLSELPLVEKGEGWELVHSSLYKPESFPYMLTGLDAKQCFDLMSERVCFAAHTHVPVIFVENEDKIGVIRDWEVELEEGSRYIVNVGSVGQPRDRDSRAAYAIYDTEAEKVEIRRVSYDVGSAADKILKAELPELLAERLFEGL